MLVNVMRESTLFSLFMVDEFRYSRTVLESADHSLNWGYFVFIASPVLYLDVSNTIKKRNKWRNAYFRIHRIYSWITINDNALAKLLFIFLWLNKIKILFSISINNQSFFFTCFILAMLLIFVCFVHFVLLYNVCQTTRSLLLSNEEKIQRLIKEISLDWNLIFYYWSNKMFENVMNM